jgi:hypothetical protein
MPTIVHSLNTAQPEQTIGKSLFENDGILSRLKKKFLGRREPVYTFAELDNANILKTLATTKWKYIYDYKAESGQLYDILSDPLEQKNIVHENIEQSERLQEQLFNWISHAKKYPVENLLFQISQEEIEKLEAIGYVDTKENMDNDEKPVSSDLNQ